MKKMIFTALLLMGFAAAGYSQERPQRVKKTPEERAQMMTDAMDKKLSLSEKQKSQIYKINLERTKEMEKSHKQAAAERKKAFEQQKKQFEASEEKINKVLNQEQKKTYAELKSRRHEKMKSKGGELRKRFRDRRGDSSAVK